jgi:CelD/BcsL family acetyltransferase involved in cellulose biosynthesis
MIAVEVIWDPTDLHSLQEDWERLFNQGANEPSTSYEWTEALVKNHLRANDRLFIMVFRKANTPVCLVPMVASEERVLGRTLVRLSPFSERYNTHSDFLSSHDAKECVQALISALYKLEIEWDVFRMARMLEPGPLLGGLEECLSQSRKKHRIQYEPPSFFLHLPESLDSYLAQRSGKFRNYLRRAEKKLKVLGEVKVAEIVDRRDLNAAYENILHIERNSWKHQHGTAISAIARQRSFYRDLCRGAAEAGRLHLSFLYLREEPIGYNMGYVHNNRYYYLKTSYHEQFRSHGAATYLRARLIESLIGKGIRSFDFPGEPYEWEQQWANELRWHKSITIYNDTLRASAYSMLSRLRRLLNRRPAGKVFEFCDAKDLQPPSD